jgi:hypothetical protein
MDLLGSPFIVETGLKPVSTYIAVIPARPESLLLQEKMIPDKPE